MLQRRPLHRTVPDGSEWMVPIKQINQIYETVAGERVHRRKTVLINRASPLHPFSICDPNLSGHRDCLPAILDFIAREILPPTMAHHYFYLQVRNTRIQESIKKDIYAQLYHTAPEDLAKRYSMLQEHFALGPPNDCRMLMYAVLDCWSIRCFVVKKYLQETKLFPVRLEWVDKVFEGTKFRVNLRPIWEGGKEVDEYGWAVEMIRAERQSAFTENCPLVFLGDRTSARLAEYIEWGKQFSDFDGRLQRRLENEGEWNLDDIDRMSVLICALKKIHFGNGCVAVVLATGRRELDEGVSPHEFGACLKAILHYLMQFDLRIIVTPPTPKAGKEKLWFLYVQQHRDLSAEYPNVEFLVVPHVASAKRCFLDAMVLGSSRFDPSVCDEYGYTDFGIKKLSFFLIEVSLIPKLTTTLPYPESARVVGQSRQAYNNFGSYPDQMDVARGNHLQRPNRSEPAGFVPTMGPDPVENISFTQATARSANIVHADTRKAGYNMDCQNYTVAEHNVIRQAESTQQCIRSKSERQKAAERRRRKKLRLQMVLAQQSLHSKSEPRPGYQEPPVMYTPSQERRERRKMARAKARQIAAQMMQTKR